MESVKSGKKIVVAVIIILLLTIVISIISTVVIGQADAMALSVFIGLVRFALIGSILYFLYAGNKVAKWLIVIISLISGINGFISSVLLTFSRALLAIDIMIMGIEIIWIAIGVVLIVVSPVNNFFKFQRGEYNKDSMDYERDI